MKFRGKRKDNGERVKGDLLRNKISLTGEGKINGQITIDNKTTFTAIVDSDGVLYEVYPESVGMSILRKDKHGVEIFGSIPINGKMSRGGDIIKTTGSIDNIETAKIEFKRGCFKDNYYGFCLSDNKEYQIEIIGKQYEEDK